MVTGVGDTSSQSLNNMAPVINNNVTNFVNNVSIPHSASLSALPTASNSSEVNTFLGSNGSFVPSTGDNTSVQSVSSCTTATLTCIVEAATTSSSRAPATVTAQRSASNTGNGDILATASAGPSVGASTSSAGPSVGAKWNMCGDCGIKFLDLMNLELHVERKHPQLKILGSVDLGEGTVCFKTGIVNNKGCSVAATSAGSSTKSVLIKDTSNEEKLTQRHACTLCHHRTTSLVTMVDHMLHVHFLTGKDMMDAIISEGEINGGIQSQQSSKKIAALNTSSAAMPSAQQDHSTCSKLTSVKSRNLVEESTRNTSQTPSVAAHKGSTGAPHPNQCRSCNALFGTSSELIRHRIKDKRNTCVVCCYLTCSRRELAEHLKTEHDWSDVSALAEQEAAFTAEDIKKKLTCWRCDQEFKKTGEFLDHLKVHGSITGKCEKCGRQDYSVANILIHMTTLHSDYMNKLTITVMSKGKTWTCTYLQTVTGELVDIAVKETPLVRKTANNSKLYENSLLKPKVKINKKRPIESEKNKRPSKSKLSSDFSKTDDFQEDCKPEAYACSKCRVCLHGSGSLELHLKQHQQSLCPDTPSGDLSSNNLKNSPPGFPRLPQKSTDSSGSHTSTLMGPGVSNASLIGLEVRSNTAGFRCQECGLTRATGEPLMNHIQKVHISGNLLHRLKQADGSVRDYPIYVITPISS